MGSSSSKSRTVETLSPATHIRGNCLAMYLVLLLYNTYSCIPLQRLLDGSATDGGDGAAVLCSSSAFSDQALSIVHTSRHSSLACGWPRSPRFISLPQTHKLADGTENLGELKWFRKVTKTIAKMNHSPAMGAQNGFEKLPKRSHK